MKMTYPVLMRIVEPAAAGDRGCIVVEQVDGDTFTFGTMAAAERFMEQHSLEAVTEADFRLLREHGAGQGAGDG